MNDHETKPTADALAQSAHAAAEAHLRACWEAMTDEEDGNENPSWPEGMAAPFCGCDTCVIREALSAAWPLLVEAARAEVEFDIQRIALRPGDKLLVNSNKEHLSMEQADRISARMREVFPDHQVLVFSGNLSLSAVSSEGHDEAPALSDTE